MPIEHGKASPKREGCCWLKMPCPGPGILTPGSQQQESTQEAHLSSSSQLRDAAGNGASNLIRRLQLPLSHTGYTPLFLSLSLKALHEGKLKRVLSSWAPCPQKKKGRRCLKYWQSSLFAARKRGNVRSGTALEMEAAFSLWRSTK